MSFFGFDAASRHDPSAPGFPQAHDPFASLSARNDTQDDVLDFEDTYDGLGDQLDETGDAFNDDTFGGDTTAAAPVGKDFDFFGQTAKVANAIEEEQVRYGRQQSASIAKHTQRRAIDYLTSEQPYYQVQTPPRPIRSGYEKYREVEQIPDLHVDHSIWGIGPPKSSTPAPPASQPLSSRKVLSLEEVEAAMRASAKRPPPTEPQPTASSPQVQLAQELVQQPQQLPQASLPHPITILQRPRSTQHKPQTPMAMPPTIQPQQHRQTPPPHPVQILQNPNRLSRDGLVAGFQGHKQSLSSDAIPRMTQIHAAPVTTQLSEQEKALLLEQETKRAKRNHKIWLLSRDNGLMTPQDKNFITRIQLQQLVSSSANGADEDASDALMAEDFYYQVYSHIRAGQRQNPSQSLSTFAQTYLFQTGNRYGPSRRHGRTAKNHVQRMELQVQRAVEAAKNKPKNPQLVIAGSLGKIAFSNAKTPKPLLNIKRTESETARSVNGKKPSDPDSKLDRKQVLRNIEQVYDTLMQIEDHVRAVPPLLTGPPDPALEKHKRWTATLDAYTASLWNQLKVHEPIGATVPHPFVAILSCAKGKKAVPRIFPHLNFEQRTIVLTMITYHLDQLDVVEGAAVDAEEPFLNSRMRENIELFTSTVMPSLMQYFNDVGLEIVDGILNLVATKLNLDLIARTKIGVAMLTLILSRAVLLKQTGAGNAEQWDKWDRSFETLFAKLEPSLPSMFPGSVNAGDDVYVWQMLAALGVSASHDQQTRLVLAVKDRVLSTVTLSKTLPPSMAAERLGSVNLFMRSIGLDVELLQ